MNDILKQRLVGALILVALGVVFWPIIFLQPDDKTASHHSLLRRCPAASIGVVSQGDSRTLPDLAMLGDNPDGGERAETDPLAVATPSTISSERYPSPATLIHWSPRQRA